MASSSASAARAPLPIEYLVLSGQRHERSGIPFVTFFDDVGEFISAHKTSIEVVIESLQTMHSKYKFMETSLVENRKALRAKIPDISASLDVVRMLQERAAADGADTPFSTYFALADQVHAKASIRPRGTVSLWLGANVMLEYSYDEARALLETQHANALTKVEETSEELDILREQTIITEVNMARALNWDVVRRRQEKIAAGAGN